MAQKVRVARKIEPRPADGLLAYGRGDQRVHLTVHGGSGGLVQGSDLGLPGMVERGRGPRLSQLQIRPVHPDERAGTVEDLAVAVNHGSGSVPRGPKGPVGQGAHHHLRPDAGGIAKGHMEADRPI